MVSTPVEPEAMNGATPQLLWNARTTDPAIEDESTDTVARLPDLERSPGASGRRQDYPPPTGHRPQQPPPTGPLLLSPSPLIRSASAPPDYLPSLPASRQHRATRGPGPMPSVDDSRAFPMPPEVVETGRREKECSACCLRCIVVMTTLRWLFVSAALLGAACVVTGIVFGVMSSTLTKDTFFVLAFTFIGLGIVLVLVVGIGWRCSPVGHEPCHALCHLTETPSGGDRPNSYDTGTQRAPRLMQRSRNQWYGGFLYPEFRYVTPPPSYSISVQQYRQQTVQQGIADGDRSILGNSSISSLDNLSSLPSSPPPSYRSRIVGRIRPPLSGVMILSCTTSDELPPPYHCSSTASSLARLADVEEDTDPGVPQPVSIPVTIEPTIGGDHRQASDPSSHPQEGGVVADLATPTIHVTNHTEVTMNASFSLVPEDVPEALPSVRSIVQRFEDIANATSSRDLSEKAGQFSSASGHLFNSCSLSGAADITDLAAADQNFDDEGQLRFHQRAVIFLADQSHPKNKTDDDDLCSISQSPETSTNINQSNVTISVEGSCSVGHSSNAESDYDQSHVRISMSDLDVCSISLLPDNSPTNNQSEARSTSSTNSSGLVCQSLPTSPGNVTANAFAVSQSHAEATAAFCFSGQSQNSRHIQILQAANHLQVSSSSNQSHHNFSRSQSLDDPEIGESGI